MRQREAPSVRAGADEAVFKIVCDHVDTLAPIGELFGPADEG